MQPAFELHGFAPALGSPSASPFVLKTLIHIELAGVSAKINLNGDVMRAPKGKLPYLVFADGSKIADSEFIYRHLCENHGLDLESHLGEAQQASGYLLARAFEEHLYFAIVANRWAPDEHWAILKRDYFDELPPVVKQIFPSVVRRMILKAGKGQGMMRHSMPEIYENANRTLRAFVPVLRDGPYLFGDKISYADTCIAPQIFGCYGGVSSPMDDVFEEHPQLKAYAERVVDLARAAVTAGSANA